MAASLPFSNTPSHFLEEFQIVRPILEAFISFGEGNNDGAKEVVRTFASKLRELAGKVRITWSFEALQKWGSATLDDEASRLALAVISASMSDEGLSRLESLLKESPKGL